MHKSKPWSTISKPSSFLSLLGSMLGTTHTLKMNFDAAPEAPVELPARRLIGFKNISQSDPLRSLVDELTSGRFFPVDFLTDYAAEYTDYARLFYDRRCDSDSDSEPESAVTTVAEVVTTAQRRSLAEYVWANEPSPSPAVTMAPTTFDHRFDCVHLSFDGKLATADLCSSRHTTEVTLDVHAMGAQTPGVVGQVQSLLC